MLDLAAAATTGFLAGYAAACVIHRGNDDAARIAAARFSCDACGAVFRSVDSAREHATTRHAAIDVSTWDAIITEV